MNNTVIGIAILDRSGQPERLYLHCQYADGTPHLAIIPVRQKDTPTPANAWKYEIKGDQIHVTPSLKISTSRPSASNPSEDEFVEVFHNTGEWSVRFQEFDAAKHESAYRQYGAANGLSTIDLI